MIFESAMQTFTSEKWCLVSGVYCLKKKETIYGSVCWSNMRTHRIYKYIHIKVKCKQHLHDEYSIYWQFTVNFLYIKNEEILNILNY